MKRILIILLTIHCSLLTVNCSAQLQGQAKIDSLLKELPRQTEDTNKAKVLEELSYVYYAIAPDEGIKYGQLGLELATKLKWNKGIASACNNLGVNYWRKSNYPKALEYYFRSLELLEAMGNKMGIASTTACIGLIYYKQKEYSKALEYYYKALRLFEEAGNKSGISNIYSYLGLIYYDQKDYPKALEYDFKSLKSDEETGNKLGVAYTACNIGLVYQFQKNYLMAVVYYRKALKLSQELGDKNGMAACLCDIGKLYIEIIKDTAAKTNKWIQSDKVTDTAELSLIKYEPTVSIPKGKAALLSGAIDYMQRGLTICKEIKQLDFMQQCYLGLSEAYKLKRDYKQAVEYQANYHAIKDSVFSQDNKEQLVKLEMKDQYERQHLTDSLKTSQKEKIADINLQKQKSYKYMGIAGIVLLMGFSFFIVKERGKSEKERKKSDGLLLNILPTEVADELKANGTTTAKHYDNVTVLFTDFVNFTQAGEQMSPQALIDELHACFKMFDEITGKYNIEKIKTIGDAYLAVCGLPTADPKHAENIVRAAVEINAFMQDRLAKMGSERTFAVRIGVHSGSVVAGIVGVKKFAYDIWGDTVNTAARMEQHGEAGKINISETTYELVKDKFTCEYRGEVEAKGKGVMRMYFVV